MRGLKWGLIGAAVGAVSAPSIAQARIAYDLSTGINYSSGDYGGAVETQVISAPLVLRLTDDAWTLRASTSYLEITGPANVAESDGGLSGGAPTRTGAVRGLGDTELALSYSFRRIAGSHAYLETTARIRIPTGDADKGLGVGVVDYGLSAEVGVNARPGGASLELTRRFLGERAGQMREDGWQIKSAGWLSLSDDVRVGVLGYWRAASVRGNADPAQLGGFMSYRLSRDVRLALDATAGLSDASPNYSVGLRLTWRTSAQ